ncbi:MAG TPA: NAD(P)-dependent oxidoreductase [Tepidisphaeraceae bacterium]|jgi:2-hydroxy-3-oxopropionate reductase|nr:NAD(P)-dependent oxidoreductase [Tepidisphaeraceae bacterium]
MKTTIAFFGTGLMGQPMVSRLLAAGFAVTVWNRTPEKADPLLASGAQWAQSPIAAVNGANVVITMLTNADAVESVLFDSGAAGAMAAGTTVIDMSTTSPPVARDHCARLASRGIGYVDAPVSGGTRGAIAGTLAIMAGGDAGIVAGAAPIFAAMGTGRRVGPVGSGQLCKLANQLIVAVTIGAVAEALVLAEKGGADPVAVREALRGGFAESRILAEHGQRMLTRDFKPGGTVNNQIKDLNAIKAFAGTAGVSLPLLTTAHGLFDQLRSHFGGDMDHSALFLEIERLASDGKHS